MAHELQSMMKLTIFIGSDERHAHHSLYSEVMNIAAECGILGATVTKGVMSYGRRRRIHSDMNEVVMENLPLIIEIIDNDESIEALVPRVAELLGERGLIELRPTKAIRLSPAEDAQEV